MKAKRPTPKKLPSGTWRCQVMVNGKRVSVTDEDPKIAQAKAMAIQAGLMKKEETRKEFLSLEDAIDDYIESKSNVLSPSTIRGYDTIKRNQFKSLMKRNVYTLSKKDIQEAVNQGAKTCAPKTISNAYGLIRPVLKELGIDVFGVRLPQKIKPNKKYLQPEDLGQLIKAVEGDLCEVAILLAMCLGLRTSEIMGLCPDCVDVKAGTITIRRTVVPDRNDKMVLKKGAKNEISQRTVACPAFIMERLAVILPSDPAANIFRFHRSTLLRHVHKACTRAGITDTTTHGLRHTNAAVMKSLGIADHVAMERGGWSDENTYKKTYSYVFESAAKDADTKISSYFENFSHDYAHRK